MSRRHRKRGFTLIEMIVATFLLAIAVVSALGAISASTRTTTEAEALQKVSLLAQKQLSDAEMQSDTLAGGDTSGDFSDMGEEYTGYRWKQSAEATDFPNLYKVTVTINWGDQNRPHSRDFVTYLRNRSSDKQQEQQKKQDEQKQQSGSGTITPVTTGGGTGG